jgi:two-component system, chemotaxis family, protein-glutamate methylesterase/glutaminase
MWSSIGSSGSTEGCSSVRVVVVGTSLGGLQALREMLGLLPGDLPAPLLIVQHRVKEGEGLCELLQSASALPVVEPEDKDELRPGQVYLAPADYHLLVEPGAVALSTDAPVNHARPSIDVLFESAADAYGPAVVAVVLTGASDDGARGALRIRQRGGTVIVQDPATAVSPIMPNAASARASIARSHSLPEIAAAVVAHCRA